MPIPDAYPEMILAAALQEIRALEHEQARRAVPRGWRGLIARLRWGRASPPRRDR